ncbi:MAG TPA: VCBS repeat-containing protein [bacterium]|nr:VCBS repeat-containing protein [bacterium]
MNRQRIAFLFAIVCSWIMLFNGCGKLYDPDWAVPELPYRLLVEVPAVDIGERTSDALTASLEVGPFTSIMTKLDLQDWIDIDSFQVIRYDSVSGKALPAPAWPFARTENERPSRFLDKSMPWNFPMAGGSTIPVEQSSCFPRGAYLTNAKGIGNLGLLAWDHVQDATQCSYYAIYFDTLKNDRGPKIPRQGFLGDGSPRRDLKASSLTGSLYNRIAVDDWDGDGLTDFIVGMGFGHVLLFRNEGMPERPVFTAGEYLRNAVGMILNAHGMATPEIVDWNGNGVNDLLVSWENAECLTWYENLGTNTERKLEYRGFIQADGKNIIVPAQPNPESPHYTRDYAPAVEAVDWDNDGDVDLLLGGYITGYIWYYENAGNGPDGTPTLTFRGPIEADGKPIDTIWGAHPCAVDLDGDGDLDLMSGSFGQAMGGGDQVSKFLHYYENTGTRNEPQFTERPVQYDGKEPSDILAQARPVDFNNDGLTDLFISTFANFYLAENTGTKTAPKWKVTIQEADWGLSPLSATQFIDWNGDGHFDIINCPLDGPGEPMVLLNEGKGTHGVFRPAQRLLPEGQVIEHPQPYGDPWVFAYVYDFEGDGDLDLIWADGPGNAYLHRNNGTKEQPDFDTAGEKLTTVNGEPIKVGPPVVAISEITDFVAMQGSRAVLTAFDFDGDGDTDLAIGDTFGDVFYYANVGTGEKPVFAEPVKLGNLGSRAKPITYDWDHDGRMDIVGAAWSGQMEWYRNMGPGAELQFAAPQALQLPPSVYYSPRLVIVDWNGDGDDDCMIRSSYPWFCWLDASYIKHGYIQGKIIGVERQ